MARCGFCGLWAPYPKPSVGPKAKAGICVWYQIRLVDMEVYESRECPDFLKKIPETTPMEHFDYKVVREGLGDGYNEARVAKRIAIASALFTALDLLIGKG